MFSSVKEVTEAGGILIEHEKGSTWNDGGSWNTWYYNLPGGRWVRVHQPTDYRSDVEVSEVRRVKIEKFVFKEMI